VVIFQTSKAGDRFKRTVQKLASSPSLYADLELWPDSSVRVDPSSSFQEMLGFGGALTDAAAINLDLMGPETRSAILDAYFAPNGSMRYNLARVPVVGHWPHAG
jgi:O-glycosyl hydrolase